MAWVVRMTDDIMRRNPAARASEFRYFAGPIFRRGRQQQRARQLAAMIEGWYDDGFSVVAVGHSNGCDLILRAMGLMVAHVEALHLISAAADADFAGNGLNDALAHGRCGRVMCYVSDGDSALSVWARLSNWVSLGLVGYGSLGWSGPQNVDADVTSRVIVVRRDYLEHGGWFAVDQYEATLNAVTVAERVHR